MLFFEPRSTADPSTNSDFIYADVPYYPDAKLSSYHKRYRQTFASPDIEALTSSFRSSSLRRWCLAH